MIDLRRRPLLEQAEWLLKKPVPAGDALGELVGQLMVARMIVESLAAEVRRLTPVQISFPDRAQRDW